VNEFIIQVGANKVSIGGTAAFLTHMQRVIIKALQEVPLSGAPGKPVPKAMTKRRRAKNRGGRKKGSRVIGGKVYTAEQIKANPALQKRVAERV
jgi:hypothetical protein